MSKRLLRPHDQNQKTMSLVLNGYHRDKMETVQTVNTVLL